MTKKSNKQSEQAFEMNLTVDGKNVLVAGGALIGEVKLGGENVAEVKVWSDEKGLHFQVLHNDFSYLHAKVKTERKVEMQPSTEPQAPKRGKRAAAVASEVFEAKSAAKTSAKRGPRRVVPDLDEAKEIMDALVTAVSDAAEEEQAANG